MIIYRPTWQGWVHLLGLRHGLVMTDKDCEWLLWERTAFPMTTETSYLGAQVHEALAFPMSDEEFMDAQDPLNRDAEADRLATELGHVIRERDALRAENARLEETVAGWRAENDRHRHLYVEAVKERDRLATDVAVLRERIDAYEGKLQDVEAERDRLQAVVDDALAGLSQLTDACRDAAEHATADAMVQVHRSLLAQLDASPAGEDT